MKYDVFISYSSHDQKIVEGLCAYLEQHRVRCFVAYRDIPHGKKWAESIVEALEQSRMMVVVFSKHFNDSDQVDREIELASEDKKPILTYRITDDAFKGTKKYYLKNINWIDAFPNPEKHFDDVTDNIAKLLNINIDLKDTQYKNQSVVKKEKCHNIQRYNKFYVRCLLGLLALSVIIVAGVFLHRFISDRTLPHTLKIVEIADKYGYIDNDGNEIVPLIYDNAWEFSDGLAWVESDGKKGCIDETGKMVIPFIYDYGWKFSEGLAEVGIDGKYGYIDMAGKVIIPFEYQIVYPFSEGLAGVRKGDKVGYINKSGEIVIPFKYTHKGVAKFSEGLSSVENDFGYIGFIDQAGNIVIPFTYYWAQEFSEGLAVVRKDYDSKHGYIDKTGEIVIPFIFDSAWSFSEGLARVEIDGKHGFIDKHGVTVIPLKYEESYDDFSEGLVPVQKDGKWGFIDKDDKVVIPFIYDYARGFSGGIAQVVINDDCFYINKKGKRVYN